MLALSLENAQSVESVGNSYSDTQSETQNEITTQHGLQRQLLCPLAHKFVCFIKFLEKLAGLKEGDGLHNFKELKAMVQRQFLTSVSAFELKIFCSLFPDLLPVFREDLFSQKDHNLWLQVNGLNSKYCLPEKQLRKMFSKQFEQRIKAFHHDKKSPDRVIHSLEEGQLKSVFPHFFPILDSQKFVEQIQSLQKGRQLTRQQKVSVIRS